MRHSRQTDSPHFFSFSDSACLRSLNPLPRFVAVVIIQLVLAMTTMTVKRTHNPSYLIMLTAWILIVAACLSPAQAFVGSSTTHKSPLSTWTEMTPLVFTTRRTPSATKLFDNKQQQFSREIYLREEAESPFRKVRFFLYASVGAGALASLLISAARVAAALNGINSDLLNESATNVAVDLGGLVLLAFLYQRDVQAQQSRLQRASKGAALAKLQVRATQALMTGEPQDSQQSMTVALSDLRRGRGIEKRVVLAVAGADKLSTVLQDIQDVGDEVLARNDLLIVPIVWPGAQAPILAPKNDDNNEENVTSNLAPLSVALPVGRDWSLVVGDEVSEAQQQGVSVEEDGVCIILKKNGRVGQRTKGINLKNMVGDVEGRREMGMDVTNI